MQSLNRVYSKRSHKSSFNAQHHQHITQIRTKPSYNESRLSFLEEHTRTVLQPIYQKENWERVEQGKDLLAGRGLKYIYNRFDYEVLAELAVLDFKIPKGKSQPAESRLKFKRLIPVIKYKTPGNDQKFHNRSYQDEDESEVREEERMEAAWYEQCQRRKVRLQKQVEEMIQAMKNTEAWCRQKLEQDKKLARNEWDKKVQDARREWLVMERLQRERREQEKT